MDSDFEPAVRTEETPEARIVIVDLQGFGFRREDLRLQINSRGNLIMSGERRGKEIEEVTKVGGRLQKMQREGQRFRKVIDVRENLNFDGITAKFKAEALRVYLPFVQSFDQLNQISPTLEVHCSGKSYVADQSVKSKDKRSNPVEPEDSRHGPEMIRSYNHKAKTRAGMEESTELLEERTAEMLENLAWEPPIGTETSSVSAGPSSSHQSEPVQSRSKQEKEDEDEGETSGKTLESRDPTRLNNVVSFADDGKPEEKHQLVLAKEGNEDGAGIVDGIIRHPHDIESCLK